MPYGALYGIYRAPTPPSQPLRHLDGPTIPELPPQTLYRARDPMEGPGILWKVPSPPPRRAQNTAPPPLRGLYTSIGPARPVGLSRRFPTVPRRFPGSGRGFTAASSSSSAAPGGSGPSRESFIQTRNGKGEAEPQRHLGEDRRAAILGGTPEVLAAQGGSRLRGGSGVILEEL